ncbi:hypothetical protein PSCICM_14890 [Pseudomonas cichorii]|uniref:Uncharacterized protein n=1 Tax=Pseudomonas cichorii TaxID=36746 RepID=A0ABQ1DI63_PSECI|nr:hypothetical protein PCH70_18670 [Pseudomonas cichorii JBC1]GFM75670.1 hypothetical protein PSCICM_14890 [Pseudomonas cichorii]GFM90691.1 hypothetical protein PSCICP_06630 [Pseudomonas cichorii]SDN62851.1 hypothetical protein SAMN05216599_102564 [Pseudomonas cichorii]
MHTAFDSAHGKPNGRIILISIACYVLSLMLPAVTTVLLGFLKYCQTSVEHD